MDSLEWVPWGQPRIAPRGVETAFHHPLIAIRLKNDARVTVVNPGGLTAIAEIESWRPMAWAAAGRRGWPNPGKLSAHTSFMGAEGHLFHTINAVCEQLFEGDVLGVGGVKLWQDLLRRRVDWCSENKIVYRHLVIPEHHSIYNDMIPDAPFLSEYRPLLKVMSGLDPYICETIVYPLEQMIAGRSKFDTSMRHDVHFTGFGSFLCYKALVSTLGNIASSEIVAERDLREREIFVAGDVAHAAGQPGQRVKFHEPPKVKHHTIVKGSSFKTNQVDVYASETAPKRTLVMFRTSNSSHLIPYLLRHFSRITAVGTTRVFYDLLASEKPDVVIAEMPERYLAPAKVCSDSDMYRSFLNDDGDFEKETGHVLPLPTA